MGIRVTCPECGKNLNVKSFLAGKRGVCPNCGGKFDIPRNSATTIEVDDAEDEIRAIPMPAQSAQPPAATPVGVAHRPIAPAKLAGGTPRPVAKPLPVMDVPGEASIPTPAGPVTTTVVTDFIGEAPHANWYVRTPAGGQFGPARGDMFRQWLQQRRVTPDSYLWREGWPDWQRADIVFPALNAASAAIPVSLTQPAPQPQFTPAIAVPVTASPIAVATAPAGVQAAVLAPFAAASEPILARNAAAGRQTGASKSNLGRFIALAILLLAILVLAPLLGYVLWHM